ncbi:MAG: hypothetical protein AMXMBFR34_40060 [Myxococcaceae bacterium]
MSLVDYLYLAQLPPLIFSNEIWASLKARLANDAKARLNDAVGKIAPVRNEIAHVREVSPERLQRANVACSEIRELLRG